MANAAVTKEMTQAFARAWDFKGLKMILDATSLQFATDWANIALKSAMADPRLRVTIFQEVLAEIKAAKEAKAKEAGQPASEQTPATAPLPQATATPAKSGIVLTDAD